MSSVPARTYRDFSTRRIVLEKVIERRLGHENPNPPQAWQWDHRHLIEARETETLPYPGLKRSHLLKLPRSYWQNGPVAGKKGTSLEITEIKDVFARGKKRWVPLIHRGDVNIWRDSTYLFSDDSVVELVDADSVDLHGYSRHVLEKVLRTTSPILATIYRRDLNGEYLPWRSFSRRTNFSTILDSNGTPLPASENNQVLWANVDQTKREFISYLQEDRVHLLFNQYVIEPVTALTVPTSLDSFNDLEYIGSSDGSNGQTFESSRFPISRDTDLAVYVVNVSGLSWTQYTVVEEFTGPNQVLLDEDLGIFTFGTTGTVTDPPPDQRGIYIAYATTPRIEYEEEGFSDTTSAISADVKPLNKSLNKGFVTFARADLDIDSIVLTTSKDLVAGLPGVYGPVYIGADYAPLFATVYAATGEVVPDIDVTFYFETIASFGGLGGSGDSCNRVTGYDGIARSFYVPPVSVDSLGFYVDSLVDANTLEVSSEANFSTEDDVYTYHVLKDDPFIGIPGADISLGEIEWDPLLFNGRKVIFYKWDDTAIHPISGHLGAYSPVRPSTITNGYILEYTDTLTNPDTTSYGAAVETGTITFASDTQLQDTTKAWDTNQWNNYVLEIDATGETRRIISNTADTLTIAGRLDAIPVGGFTIYDRAANLGAYWIVSDRIIQIRASAYSPKYDRTIYSNILTLRVEIPQYMKGSYIQASLEEIPFGWRILDDQYDTSSAINGATYISINPVAGPYPIVDVIGGETWDPYSGPDLGTEPYPWWPYNNYPSEGVSSPFAHFAIFWNATL